MGKTPTLDDFFGEKAREYEENKNLKKLQIETVHRALDLLEDNNPNINIEKLLDIGCGTGWSMEIMKERGYTDIQGVDISEDMLAFAREKEFEVQQADIRERLPFIDEEFRSIIAISVMNFVEEGCKSENEIEQRYKHVADEIFRILKPGGRAVLQHFKKPKNVEELMLTQFRHKFTGGVIIDDENLRKEKRFLVIDKRI